MYLNISLFWIAIIINLVHKGLSGKITGFNFPLVIARQSKPPLRSAERTHCVCVSIIRTRVVKAQTSSLEGVPFDRLFLLVQKNQFGSRRLHR